MATGIPKNGKDTEVAQCMSLEPHLEDIVRRTSLIKLNLADFVCARKQPMNVAALRSRNCSENVTQPPEQVAFIVRKGLVG